MPLAALRELSSHAPSEGLSGNGPTPDLRGRPTWEPREAEMVRKTVEEYCWVPCQASLGKGAGVVSMVDSRGFMKYTWRRCAGLWAVVMVIPIFSLGFLERRIPGTHP